MIDNMTYSVLGDLIKAISDIDCWTSTLKARVIEDLINIYSEKKGVKK